MPWYWTDDLGRFLVSEGIISERVAAHLEASPIAIRRVEASIEEAALGMVDDDEIPLAA